MKHIHLFIATLVLCFCTTMQAKERVIDQPPFCVRNTTSIEVSKVVMSDTATVLHIYAKYRPKNWIRIASGSYLRDNNGETYQLRSGIGITPNENFWLPESGEAEFQLVFPPVNAKATFIDFTEGEGEGAFSIWGIQLKGNKLPAMILPKEAVVHKTDKNSSLPEPVIKYDKAILKGKLLDYRTNMSISTRILVFENTKGNTTEATLEIQPDGSFEKEITLVTTSPCNIYVNNGDLIQFFMEPGKTTELYINLRELSRRQSNFFSKEKPYGELAYINGPLQVVAQELNSNWENINVQDDLYKDFSILNDKDITTVKEYILAKSAKAQLKIDKLPCSTATRQLLTINNKLTTYGILSNVPSLLTSAALSEKKITRENANEYYKNLSKQLPADYIPNADIAILNTTQTILSSQYLNIAGPSLIIKEELTKAWGTDKGIFFDIARNIPIIYAIKNYTPLTDEQKASLETMPAAYREMLIAANNELLAQIEINKKKTGFTINEVGEVSNEELFASIINKYKGKVVLIDFWATWCGPCRSANKAMTPMKEELKDKEIVYVYLAGENSPVGTWQNMIPDIHGEHYRLNADQWKHLSKSFDIKGVPTYMVIDAEGNKTFNSTGFPGVSKMKEELLKAIK